MLTRDYRGIHFNAVLVSEGNPNSVPIMSPAGATSLEDQQYMEKLKQLSKYIEPLRRMINKIDKNEGIYFLTITFLNLN